jgi:hypothetical protein
LLQLMEVLDEEMEVADVGLGEQCELSREMISQMEDFKKEPRMGLCDQGSKKPRWGPTLVERQIKTRNNGGTMLQKVMELKQKKNLEPIKGNSFSVLQSDSLNQIALDVNLKIGSDVNEKDRIIYSLLESEKVDHENFVNENPGTNLPSSVELEQVMKGVAATVEGAMISVVPGALTFH